MYEVNSNTLVVMPLSSESSEIIEVGSKYLCEISTREIIDESCKINGSSYLGRLAGTKKILGISYKAPIIINEQEEMIFFPTSSPRFDDCIWISLKRIKNYIKYGKSVRIIFDNNDVFDVNMSYNSFDNQVLRSARLQMLLKLRKNSIR